MKLTRAQEEAVRHSGSNLLVSASAGSGKTQVLAERCLHLLSDPADGCDVQQLLVLTFTRAAAAELRSRVGRRLREAARTAQGAGQRSHLLRQAMRLDLAEIGTIDAWCQRQVREHFSRCGVDPVFRLIGEEDAALLRRETLDELFAWICTADDGVARATRDWIRRSGQASDEWLRDHVRALSTFREHLVNPHAWFARQRELLRGGDADSARAGVAEAIRHECGFQLEQLPTFAGRVSHPGIRESFASYAARLAAWTRALADPSSLDAVIVDIHDWKPPGYNGRKLAASEAEKSLRNRLKKRWHEGRLKNVWTPEVLAAAIGRAHEAAQHLLILFDLEQRYDDLLAALKRGLAAYEFADVQRMALDVLGEPPGDAASAESARIPSETALRLRERYAHVLIDEYQDTSPVQVELLRLVSREGARASNRFMVGDVKQSIYGFRQAEPRLFSALAERLRSGTAHGSLHHLSDNFRTHAAVLDALNEMFAMLLEPELGGTPFGEDERLQACRGEIPNPSLAGSPRVYLHVVPRDGPAQHEDDELEADEKPPERIEIEARVAAREIQRLMRAATSVPRRLSDDTMTLRPARYGDFVILLRSARFDAARVAATLREARIPCVAAGRESAFDSREVRDLRSVFALLGNRRQDVPLAGYLRGPLVGLSDLALLAIRRHCGGPFHRAVLSYARSGESEPLRARVADALGNLDAWREYARQEELPGVLRRIVRDTQLDLLAHGMPGGAQRASMLRALAALAQRFMQSGGGGPAEFAEWLDALSDEELVPSVTAPDVQDAVTIITIHAAKGLEFPFVFLLGAGASLMHRTRADRLPCDVSAGVGLRGFNFFEGRMVCNAAYPIAAARQRRRSLEEELRLLYVATTRTRERLHIIGTEKPGIWADVQSRFPARERPLLIDRIGVRSVLEWVLLSVAAAGLHQRQEEALGAVRVIEEDAEALDSALPADDMGPEQPPAPSELNREDECWVDAAERLFTAETATDLSGRPAVLSVSAFKALAGRDMEQDPSAILPNALDHLGPALGDPSFASMPGTDEIDGRVAGTALHRFMQHADLARLRTPDEVRFQVTAFAEAKLLRLDEAPLIPADDIAWFAGTQEGRWLAAARHCRREAPFVYGLPIGLDPERIVLRGVIDCLVEEEDGLHLLDYKTDNPPNERDYADRVTQYSIQLQLYAEAARAIYGRSVQRALLVFLRMRRIVRVPLDGPMVPGARRVLDTLRVQSGAR